MNFKKGAMILSSLILIASVISLAYVSAELEISGTGDTDNIINLVSPETSLLTSDNTWTGTNTFEDDVTFESEINGDIVRYTFSREATVSLDSSISTTVILGFGAYDSPTNNAYGYLLQGTGSIKEYNCQYDVTATGGTGFPVLRQRIYFDGGADTNVGMNTAVGNNKESKGSEARGTSDYADGDIMAMALVLEGFGGTPTVTLRRITCDVELYKDD